MADDSGIISEGYEQQPMHTAQSPAEPPAEPGPVASISIDVGDGGFSVRVQRDTSGGVPPQQEKPRIVASVPELLQILGQTLGQPTGESQLGGGGVAMSGPRRPLARPPLAGA